MEPHAQGPVSDLGRRCEQEIIDIEEFFEGWISGRLDSSDETFARFSGLLAPAFNIVGPTCILLTRIELLEYMRNQHGTDPQTSRWVENPRVAHDVAGLVVVVFDEWQIRDGVLKASTISVVATTKRDDPDGIQWVHIHETPLIESTDSRPPRSEQDTSTVDSPG